MDKLALAFNEVMQNKSKYRIKEEKGHQGIGKDDNDGVQEEYNERFFIYSHPNFPENMFLKETLWTDSYGDIEYIKSFKFVIKTNKSITIYE